MKCHKLNYNLDISNTTRTVFQNRVQTNITTMTTKELYVFFYTLKLCFSLEITWLSFLIST